jgi:hypothetical protein
MNADDSMNAGPGPGLVKAWAENLAGGVRLALFRKPAAFAFHASAIQFIAIALTGLAVNCACSFALAGFGGTFDLLALPSELFWVPLGLLAGYLVARVMKDENYALLVPIVVGSIGIVLTVAASLIWFAADRRWFTVPAVLGLTGVYQLAFVWWAASVTVAVRRLTIPLPDRGISPVAIVAIVVLLPAYFLPAEPLWEAALDPDEAADQAGGKQAAFSESALYAQPQLLRAAVQQLKPERAGVEDLYFVGFAPYASQDVFMKETLSIGKLLEERFDVRGRAISLISHASLEDKYPIATLTSLRNALRAVGERINPEEDVVLLHLTSHGSEAHELSVEFYPLELQAIRPGDLRAALDDAGIKWRIVVISACYSGGFIDALKDAHTLVVTASDAKHTSFGCGNAFDFTYFSKAYYDEALRKTYSFENAFALAKESVRLREQKEGLEPSNPQIYVGEAMKEKLSRLEKRLSAGAADAK